MNTKTTTASLFRRITVGILLALGLSVSTVALNPTPAHAASYIEGCFRPYKDGLGVAGTSYTLQAYWQGRWYDVYYDTLGNSGCVYLNVSRTHQGYPLRLKVYHSSRGITFVATSPYYAPAGTGRYNVGTARIQCFGCVV